LLAKDERVRFQLTLIVSVSFHATSFIRGASLRSGKRAVANMVERFISA
jgi:hypothetical protein